MIVHAEDPHHLAAAPQKSSAKYADFLASRPRDAENTAIENLIAQARRLDARVHVLHLSSSDALPLIAAARAEGRPGHGRDLPALPDPHRGGSARRRH